MVDREADINKYVPENPVSPIPVVVFMGTGVTLRDYHLLRTVLAENGFNSFCPDPNLAAAGNPKKWGILTDADNIKQQTFRETIDSVGYPNQDGVKQIYAIAHSSAILYLLPVIKEQPESSRKLILLAPAGIQPEMNPLKAVFRLWKANQEHKKDKKTMQGLGIYPADEYSLRRNWRSYLPEVLTIATTVISKDIEELSRAGLDVTVAYHSRDRRFPREFFISELDQKIVPLVEIIGSHGQVRFDRAVASRLVSLLKTS